MQAPQVQKRRKISVLARKAAEKASGGSTRLAPSAGPHHPASHAQRQPSCPTTAAWGAPACGSLGWSTACTPGMELLAGSKRNEGRGSDSRDAAAGTCHGPRHPWPHSGWWAAVHAALGGSAVDAVSERILRVA